MLSQPSADGKAPLAWHESRRFRIAALIFLGVLLAVSALQGIFQRDNDYLVHYEQGVAALQGHLYLNNTQYAIGRQMLNAVIVVPPYRLSRAIVYILAIAGLVISVRWWNRMADARGATLPSQRVSATLLSVLMCVHYLFRDLDDCGLQIILLFLLTGGAWAMTRGKKWQAGAWLALAASYKTPAVLFLPFLLYKRRWHEAAHMVAFLVLINVLLPAGIFGVAETRHGWNQFLTTTAEVMMVRDPSLNPVEPPKHQNQSLKLSLARLVERYEPEHPLAVPIAADVDAHDAIKDDYYSWLISYHTYGDTVGPSPQADPPIRTSPFFVQIASLQPRQANVVVTAVLLILAAAFAWRFRRPWTDMAGDADLPVQWAAVTALCALLSPLCWMHHLVLVLPATLLVLRAQLGQRQPLWRRAILGYAVFTMVFLVYDLLTRHGWLLVIANGLHTWACMGLLLLLLTVPQPKTVSALSTTSSTVTA